LDFSLAGTSEAEAMRRALAATERLRSLPGVISTGLTTLVPYNSSIATTRLLPAEAPAPTAGLDSGRAAKVGIYSSITPGYFDSIGVPMLRGRDFRETEIRAVGGSRVCIVDEGMAEKLFPGEEPLGRRVRYAEPTAGGASGDMEIVGIVRRHAHGMEDRGKPAPGVYVPIGQEFSPALFLVVRSSIRDQAALTELMQACRRELHELDPELPVLQMVTFPAFIEKNFTLRMMDLGATIFGVFGGVALLLASVGVYGVKAYAVERRTREIGVRIALGANRSDVLSLIMKQGAQQTLVALAIGFGLSFVAGRVLGAIFFQLKSFDPLVLGSSAAILACATTLACLVPARRATRVSPLTALRAD
jgi:hypothetical protein